MAETGYAISERDYRRIEETIRRVERMADVNFRRRFPVHNFGIGEGGEIWAPTASFWVPTATFQMTRTDHLRKWLFIDNNHAAPVGIGADITITTPVDMQEGDPYWLYCTNELLGFFVHLYPSPGQSIIVPSTTAPITYGDGHFLKLGAGGAAYYGGYQLILIAKDPTTWITWSVSGSEVG